MTPSGLLVAGGALALTLGLGTIAHELSHAVVLRAIGVPCRIEWLPDRRGSGAPTPGFFRRWATVTPTALPSDLSPWGLRVAAVAPMAMAAPMALVLVGVLPDPIATGNLPLAAAALAWFGCALPSPRDFSLAWHPGAAIAGESSATPLG